VNRMCKELEAVGLQDPEYRLNAFMLQAIIRNSAMVDEKPRFGDENHGLVTEKPQFEPKKPLFEVIEEAVRGKVLTPTISENVKEIVRAFDMNQIFGRKEVKKELGYGDYKAGKAIEAMQLLGIVIPVEGKGKGKYILKEMQ
ncbi:MAG: ATP-dependent DNA helicase RecG, partial [Anaerostipes sp.]|nr:ATP-dependent DNA helicase RecG [Anaerostipes sp.]